MEDKTTTFNYLHRTTGFPRLGKLGHLSGTPYSDAASFLNASARASDRRSPTATAWTYASVSFSRSPRAQLPLVPVWYSVRSACGGYRRWPFLPAVAGPVANVHGQAVPLPRGSARRGLVSVGSESARSIDCRIPFRRACCTGQ